MISATSFEGQFTDKRYIQGMNESLTGFLIFYLDLQLIFHTYMLLYTVYLQAIFAVSLKQSRCLATKKSKVMKKTIILSALIILATAFTANAQQDLAKGFAISTNGEPVSFDRIVIDSDIDVMLFEQPAQKILVEGHPKNTANVKWSVKDHVLYLRSNRSSLKGKVLVTVAVYQLKNIEVNGNSTVKSLGSLNSPFIRVQLNGEGSVALQNTGRINVSGTEGTGVEVKKSIGHIRVETK